MCSLFFFFIHLVLIWMSINECLKLGKQHRLYAVKTFLLNQIRMGWNPVKDTVKFQRSFLRRTHNIYMCVRVCQYVHSIIHIQYTIHGDAQFPVTVLDRMALYEPPLFKLVMYTRASTSALFAYVHFCLFSFALFNLLLCVSITPDTRLK